MRRRSTQRERNGASLLTAAALLCLLGSQAGPASAARSASSSPVWGVAGARGRHRLAFDYPAYDSSSAAQQAPPPPPPPPAGGPGGYPYHGGRSPANAAGPGQGQGQGQQQGRPPAPPGMMPPPPHHHQQQQGQPGQGQGPPYPFGYQQGQPGQPEQGGQPPQQQQQPGPYGGCYPGQQQQPPQQPPQQEQGGGGGGAGGAYDGYGAYYGSQGQHGYGSYYGVQPQAPGQGAPGQEGLGIGTKLKGLWGSLKEKVQVRLVDVDAVRGATSFWPRVEMYVSVFFSTTP